MPKENYLNSGGTILVSGHAKFPSNSAARSLLEICTITVEVEIKNWEILSADCFLITDTAQNFVSDIITNHALTQKGFNAMKEELERRYFGYAKKTIISAVLDLEINVKNVKNLLGNVEPDE